MLYVSLRKQLSAVYRNHLFPAHLVFLGAVWGRCEYDCGLARVLPLCASYSSSRTQSDLSAPTSCVLESFTRHLLDYKVFHSRYLCSEN